MYYLLFVLSVLLLGRLPQSENYYYYYYYYYY
jgi:hypothetical protein